MADLLPEGWLHVVLVEAGVEAVVEIVGGYHQEGEEEDDGVDSVVSIPGNSNVKQRSFNLQRKKTYIMEFLSDSLTSGFSAQGFHVPDQFLF